MSQVWWNRIEGSGTDVSTWTHGERMVMHQSKLLGIPAGIEAYRSGKRGWALHGAALKQMGEPVSRGLFQAMGGDVIYPAAGGITPDGYHYLGFGFERSPQAKWQLRAAIRGDVPIGQAHPYRWAGRNAAGKRTMFSSHAISKSGSAWMKSKAGATMLPVVGGMIAATFTVAEAARGYHEGGIKGAATAAGKVGLEMIGFNLATRLIGPAYLPLAAAGIGLTVKMGQWSKDMAYQSTNAGPNLASGDMSAFHTRSAHTMRQRSLQAIQKSHLNARSALGNEAQHQHISSIRML